MKRMRLFTSSLIMGLATLCPFVNQAQEQPTEPTETHALITVHVQDFKKNKKPGE